MYMSGLSGGPYLRAYIFTPAGSNEHGPYASVCGTLPNGCFNTGRIDMGAPQGQACLDPDAIQFDSFQKMAAHASANKETLKEFSTVADMTRFCATAGVASPAGAMQAPTYTPPTINQIPAPDYTNPSFTSSGARKLPTGIATASAPPTGAQIIMQPYPAEFGTPDDTVQDEETLQAGFSPLGIALIVGVGLLALTTRRMS